MHNNLLEPKEIDKYFRITKKDKAPSVGKHTRLVTLAKLALPGIAGILVVTLLVLPSLKDEARDFTLDFAIGRGDIEKMNIENTTIYVTNDKNRVNNFTSQQIKETSAGSKQYDLVSPQAILPLDNNEWISIQAPQGFYDQQKALLELSPEVEAFYSNGMSIRTTQAFFNFNDSRGYSDKPVSGDGFLGQIKAQGFEFSTQYKTLTFVGKTTIIIDEESLKKE